MIITKEIEITFTNATLINIYREKGIKCKKGDIITIPINLLSKGSNYLIDIKCDFCGIIIKRRFNQYNNETKNEKYPTCCNKKECIYEKRKIICLEKYGVENISQLESTKNKVKESNLKKFGVEYPLQNKEIKEKMKNNNLEKYGFENAQKNIDVKNKTKQTNLEKYGFENASQNKDIKKKTQNTINKKYGVNNISQFQLFKDKKKSTCLKNHGVEYPIQNEIIKEKTKQTLIDNYGVEYPLQNEIIKEKTKQTNLKRYGVDNPNYLKEIKDKIKNTRIERGLQRTDENISEYEKYRMNVLNITKKNKKELLNIWDGYDYYDGEYIKDNFNLKSYDKNYPTIDHKISVVYGFKNKIDYHVISDMDNLCITKSNINLTKNYKCELDFLLNVKNK